LFYRVVAEPVIDLSADFKSMKVSQLRRILEEQGEDCALCVEKADFIEKIHVVAAKQRREKR
jgi:hypothetical protein